jgi:hypothetical protein
MFTTYTTGGSNISPSSGNLPWHSGGAMFAMWYATYSGGLTAATITAQANSSYVVCAIYGADPTTPIDAAAGQATSNSATMNFPSVTPNYSNDELILFPGGAFTSPIYSPTYPTTTTDGTTSAMTQVCSPFVSNCSGVDLNPPELLWFQQNQGPGSATATSTATYAVTSAAADNIGVSVLLKSAPFAPLKHPLVSPRTANNKGFWYDETLSNNSSLSWDIAGFSQPWLDGVAMQEPWYSIEGNVAPCGGAGNPTCSSTCDTFSWDDLDNKIINSRIQGIFIKLAVNLEGYTPCGGSNQPSCNSFSPSGGMPSFALASNTCTNSGAPNSINSWWVATFGPGTGSPDILADPNDAHLLHAESRFISQMGTRYGGISNITAISGPFGGRSSVEVTMNTGANNSTVACGLSNANCALIS